MSVIEHKCPNCGAHIEFNESTQTMTCEFCESSFNLADLAAQSSSTGAEGATPQHAWDVVSGGHEVELGEGQENLRAWTCPSCGGQIIGGENTVATRCPYCDNNAIIASQLEGSFKPDYVIPFSKTKEEAQAAYRENCEGRRLLPRDYLSEERLEDITGMYVPFWLYSCDVHGSFKFEAEKRTERFTDTQVDHYECNRVGNLSFHHVPADGSKSMDDTYMEAIEPFDFSELKPFDTAYLSGHLADRYDVAHHENVDRIRQRLQKGTEDAFAEPIHERYGICSATERHVEFSNQNVEQALLPVWMLNARYDGELYSFAMNGQTGELIGRLPVSRSRQIGHFFAFLIPCILAVCLLCAIFVDTETLTMAIAALAGVVIDVFIIWFMTKGMNTAEAVDTATDYVDRSSITYEIEEDRLTHTTYESDDD